MASGPFWIAMICQIVIVVGYLWFYRKEQLGEFINAGFKVPPSNAVYSSSLDLLFVCLVTFWGMERLSMDVPL